MSETNAVVINNATYRLPGDLHELNAGAAKALVEQVKSPEVLAELAEAERANAKHEGGRVSVLREIQARAEALAKDGAAGAVEVPQGEAEAAAEHVETPPDGAPAGPLPDAKPDAPQVEAAPPKLDPRDPGPYLDAIGLEPEHILSSRVDGDRLRLVTRGGRKLALPDDEAKARALTQGERDGVVRTSEHVNTHPINAGRK